MSAEDAQIPRTGGDGKDWDHRLPPDVIARTRLFSFLGMLAVRLKDTGRSLQEAGVTPQESTETPPIVIPVAIPSPAPTEPNALLNEQTLAAGNIIAGIYINSQRESMASQPLEEQQLYISEMEGFGQQVADSLSMIGGFLFDALYFFGRDTEIGGHPIAEIEAIDATQAFGLKITLVHTPPGTPRGTFGARVTLSDIDRFRVDGLQALHADLEQHPDWRGSVGNLLNDVTDDRIFPD